MIKFVSLQLNSNLLNRKLPVFIHACTWNRLSRQYAASANSGQDPLRFSPDVMDPHFHRYRFIGLFFLLCLVYSRFLLLKGQYVKITRIISNAVSAAGIIEPVFLTPLTSMLPVIL